MAQSFQNQIQSLAATRENAYVTTDLGLNQAENKGIITDTLGVIKNNILDFLGYSTGLDENVSKAYAVAMLDPSQSFEVRGVKYTPMPGVGNMRAYNENGNPSGGCFTMHTMA